MKARTLIAIGAILAMVAIVGCSNGSRTMAPANATDMFQSSLELSSDGASVNRFDPYCPPTIDELQPEYITFRGLFYRDKIGCIYVQMGKDQFIELTFPVPSPTDVANGTPVEVIGNFGTSPFGRCQLGPLFEARSLNVLIDDQSHPDGPAEFQK